MTVRELRKILKDCEQDLPVIISAHPDCNGETGQQVSVWEGDGFIMIYAGFIPYKYYTLKYSQDTDSCDN